MPNPDYTPFHELSPGLCKPKDPSTPGAYIKIAGEDADGMVVDVFSGEMMHFTKLPPLVNCWGSEIMW